MRIHVIQFLAVVCGACLLVGCSSISTRSVAAKWSSPPPPQYFGGVRSDYHGIIDVRPNESPAFWFVYSVIDMPFSACGDILLLPYDVYADCQWRHHTNGTTVTITP
jgi:uncharacterized protein YceK